MDLLITLSSIFAVNILLSGDNSLVIALASQGLPEQHKKLATIFGCAGAVLLIISLAFIVAFLLQIPFLKVAGGLLLLWIAIKLVIAEENKENEVQAQVSLWQAVKTIIVADVVMSLDNVVAIAGVANGDKVLIAAGVCFSVPIIIWGSNLISLLMKKWPITIIIGAGILGWTAGEMVVEDKKIITLLTAINWIPWTIPLTFTVSVTLLGIFMSRKNTKQEIIFSSSGQVVQTKKA